MIAGRRPPLAALAAVAFLLVAVGIPVALLVGGGVGRAAGAGTLGATLADPVTVRAVQNSLTQGALAAIGATALGMPAGIALGRYDFRGRDAVRGLLLVPFLLPALTMVVALGRLFGPDGIVSGALPVTGGLGHGLAGVVTVDILYNAPIVALFTSVGVESANPELEETVRALGGGTLRAFRDAWGLAAATGAAAGAVLAFALSALAFAAPIAIGGASNYTLEARVWSLDQVLAEPSSAAVVAALAIAVLAGPMLLYAALVRRLGSSGGAVRHRPSRPVGPRDPLQVALMGALALLGLLEASVVGAVLTGAVAPASPHLGSPLALAALGAPAVASKAGLPLAGAFANSAIFAALAASLALLLALGLASRRGIEGALGRSTLTLVPLGLLLVSPVVLALAIATSDGPYVGPSEVWALIVLSQAVLALPFVAQSLGVALARIPAALGESARTLGSSPTAAFLEVDVPAARGGVAAAGLLAVALCLGEFTATYFLAVPRFTTVTVALYRLQDARLVPEASALAALLTVASAAVLAATALGGRRVAL